MPDLDPRTTALVLIDLQNGIVGMPLAPRSGAEVLANAKVLAERFRQAGAPVVLVRVAFAEDFADAPRQPVDQPLTRPPGGLPAGWSVLADGLAQPKDILITKRNWGAFHGTELDLQLRRRGVRTIVLGGIATNFGVESTAREAWQHGYEVIVAEDACTSMSAELHDMSVRFILPRIARVRKSADAGFAGS
ncbi:MAG: hydrolase [Acetobacteraceae bacterium]|nr:hydrolase [Acetobacteraceae bacterium]